MFGLPKKHIPRHNPLNIINKYILKLISVFKSYIPIPSFVLLPVLTFVLTLNVQTKQRRHLFFIIQIFISSL